MDENSKNDDEAIAQKVVDDDPKNAVKESDVVAETAPVERQMTLELELHKVKKQMRMLVIGFAVLSLLVAGTIACALGSFVLDHHGRDGRGDMMQHENRRFGPENRQNRKFNDQNKQGNNDTNDNNFRPSPEAG